MGSVKQEARQIVDNLPEEASWDDLMYQIYVQTKIKAGLRDVEEGRVVSHEEAKKRILSE
jgi:predicted transcriptional regulator